MVVSCGIDAEELSRFDKHLPDPPESSAFIRLVYTPDEIRHLQQFPDTGFPLAFCAKEAVFKALGRSWTNSTLDWKEIQLRLHDGCESLLFTGAVKARLDELGITRWQTSWSMDKEFAMFSVCLLR